MIPNSRRDVFLALAIQRRRTECECVNNGGRAGRDIASVWNGHGEGGFEFEILETLPEDVSPVALGDLLRERQKHRQAKLHGLPLYP